MKKVIIISFALFLNVCLRNSVYGQTSTDSLINAAMTFLLKDDTLFSSTGPKLFKGQKLIIGNSSGEAGQYRSIISYNAAIVPTIWGEDKRFDSPIENYVDSKRSKAKLKKSLIPGNVLTIQGMGLWKSRPNFYIIRLLSGSDSYKCDIKLALILRELMLEL